MRFHRCARGDGRTSKAETAAVALAAFADGVAVHRALEPGLITKERARHLACSRINWSGRRRPGRAHR
ncbi:TetR family transcriptional regulator C-terminal domain-containing protein [Amycolatopsis sp. lyj-109]|uniref:TetR family transcriptional regulator C-terminal domain-containing protein n=1 Tax=Amycolatopsis sp. lyj-109 TaxID=2789287 RepID=UPI0039781864